MSTLSVPAVLPTALMSLLRTSWPVPALEAMLSALGALFLTDAIIDPEMGIEI